MISLSCPAKPLCWEKKKKILCVKRQCFLWYRKGVFCVFVAFLTVHTSLWGFSRSSAARIPEAPMERACISCFCFTVDQNEIQLFSMSYVLWHIVKLLQSHSSCPRLSPVFFFPRPFLFTSLSLLLHLFYSEKHTCQWRTGPTMAHPRGFNVKINFSERPVHLDKKHVDECNVQLCFKRPPGFKMYPFSGMLHQTAK